MEISRLTPKEILDKYASRLSSKGPTRKRYLEYARSFLEYAAGAYDRPTIDNFLSNLRRNRRYKDGTVNLVFRTIRTMFNRNGLDWPYNRGEAPVIKESSIVAPALNPITVKRLIEAVKMNDNPCACAMLALSTTYGLRRQELINITAEDIRYNDKTIHIATLKHGRERTHVLPEPIIPWLQIYDFHDTRSDFRMLDLWYTMEDMIGLKHIDHVGWHSVRRTLDTLLLRKFTETEVSSFLRWKQATSSNMPFRYSRTEFVGEEENVTELGGESLSVDQKIFAKDENGNYKHPFVGEW
ncbi:MAG: tyrosine-type recombinase/integrase [Candidatus Marinimicrobia bacterium]|nr:tyrosine-type recombinase/integrase [Candidatus Neomarinimicrobiota bacterium]